MASRTAVRHRRIGQRLGAVVVSCALTATVLASTVTAAPTLPGWVLLPLEASGMPAHMTGPQIVTTSPERAEVTISLADYAAAQVDVKDRSTALTAASRSQRVEQEERIEKVTPSAAVSEHAAATPGGDAEVLVPDDGAASMPATEPAPAPEPEPEPVEPEPTPEPEPVEPEPAPEPEPVEEPTQPEPAPEPEESAPAPETEQPSTAPEESTDAPAETPAPAEPETAEPTPAPSASPTPAPSPTPTPTPTPSQTPTPRPTPTPTPTPTPSPTPTPKPTPTPTPAPPAGKCDTSTARSTLFSLINSYRASLGIAPLKDSGHLQNVAQGWANQLRSIDAVQHNPNYRAQVGVGVPGSGWTRASELVVRNTGGASMSCGSLLSWMHNWWLGSGNHEPWMRDPGYTHVGYGFAYSNSGVPFAVTVLGRNG